MLYLRRVHFFCLYCGEEYDDERMLASKCGPTHIRNIKNITRSDIDNSLSWAGSKSFEEKYLQAAKERLEKGEQQLKKPEDDKVLQEMKQQYAEKKTVEV